MDNIDNKDKFFKGQMSDENYVLFFRKHWATIAPAAVIFCSVCIGVIVFITFLILIGFKDFNAGLRYFIIFSSLTVFLIYGHWFFLRMFGHFMTICVFSDRRIFALLKTVYTQDLKETADLGTIQDVKKDQEGIIRNILKYGNLIITFSSSSAIMILSNVPNVEFHFRALLRAKAEFMAKREHQAIDTRPQKIPETQPLTTDSITYGE